MARPEYDTVDQMIRARAGDPNPALLFEEERWSWAEHVQASAARAALALDLRREGPFHIGFLLENVPECSFWLGAGAVSGATMVGINPTRRGAELARDITYTDCQLIVTESRYADVLHELGLDLERDQRILVVDTPQYLERLAPYAGASLPPSTVEPKSTAVLIFTSGTSGAPKAVITSHARWTFIGQMLSLVQNLTAADVFYEAMPLFHSNALFAGWSPCVYVGGTLALRRKFSASSFLPDIRKFGATYMNYVGKPLTYILATPETPDDKNHRLRLVFGNEAAERDIGRFRDRFGVVVQDAYGSTETGANVTRPADTPPGALGRAPDGTVVLDPETLEEKPPACFDAAGRLLNSEECIGELVNKNIGAGFEGYYRNDEANQQRIRHGWYWTGDLAYRDAAGWFYFAGRDFEWLRVDGENFSAAPLEAILMRFEGVLLCGVYAVPDEDVGDQVMAILQVSDLDGFDAAALDAFLERQSDLGTKWSPRYIRVAADVPLTSTAKLLKRQLRAERWECSDPVWFRSGKGEKLRRLETDDIKALRARFAERGRLGELDKL